MLRRTFGALSWAYHSVVDPLVFPWGSNPPVDKFPAYLLVVDHFLINGVVSLFSAEHDGSSDRIKFEYLQFEDHLSPQHRQHLENGYKFYIALESFREIAFYYNSNFLSSPDTEPIDVDVLSQCVSTGNQGADIVTSENIVFCNLRTRVDSDQDSPAYVNCCNSRMEGDRSIQYEFCFGLSMTRSQFLLYHLKRLCPLMRVRSKKSEIPLPQQPTMPSELTALSKVVNSDPLNEIWASNNANLECISLNSKIFTPNMFSDLSLHFPSRTCAQNINLVYSTVVHGTSISTLYRLANKTASGHSFSPIFLLVLKDFQNTVFGALMNQPPCLSRKYYGTGESFVFTFKNEAIEVYHWSETNEFFAMGTHQSFIIGSDSGHNAIWIDDRLFKGCSQPCSTFNSPMLSRKEDFECRVLELWAFSIF